MASRRMTPRRPLRLPRVLAWTVVVAGAGVGAAGLAVACGGSTSQQAEPTVCVGVVDGSTVSMMVDGSTCPDGESPI
jgi:hypothetical protein